MPLHISYRPVDFNEVIGNEKIITSLKSLLKRKEDMPHAILFEGASGCGKTTLARIVAKHLGCPATINNQPNPDLMEFDMAQMTGIETARDIKTKMHYLPIQSDCRVYILDEVHRGTGNFQDGMLKALEDTPKHVFFILCTTEPGKLLPTIRNRCSSFQVSTMVDEEIELLIKWVVEGEFKESIDSIMTKEAIDRIIEESDGCPRQVLVILDQVIDLPKSDMASAVSSVYFDDKTIYDLIRALVDKKKNAWKIISDIIKGLPKDTPPEKVRYSVLNYVNKVVLGQTTPEPRLSLIMTCFREPFYNTGMSGVTLACLECLMLDE